MRSGWRGSSRPCTGWGWTPTRARTASRCGPSGTGQAVDALWEGGFLYACDCTRDQIDARNKAAGIKTPGYDGFCRTRGLPRGDGRALRFRTPAEGVTIVHDVIRGTVEFPCDAMDDFVVVKANGAPLFVLANVVDDIDMAITHVIRGEDLLPTTPKGILAWEALASTGWRTDGSVGGAGGDTPPLPVFAHLPMLVNEQRKKLSKRRDPVAVESYRDQGYLPEAFVNYLGLLGWSPPDGEEIFAVGPDDRVVPPGGRQPLPGLLRRGQAHPHERGVHPGHGPRRVHRCLPAVADRGRAPWPGASFDEAVFAHMAPLVQERVSVLSEVPAMVDFLFLDEPVIEEEAWSGAVAGDEVAATILSGAIEAYRALAGAGDWNRDALHAATLAVGEGVGRKLGKAQAPDPGGDHRSAGGPPAVRGPRGARARSDPGPPGGRAGPRRRPVPAVSLGEPAPRAQVH